MNEQQSIAHQLQSCTQTIDHVKEVKQAIRLSVQQYQDIIDELRQQGGMEEIIENLLVMQQEFEDLASDLIKHINNEHLDYLSERAKSLYLNISDLLKYQAKHS